MEEKQQLEILRRNFDDYLTEQEKSFSQSPLTTQHIVFGLDNVNHAELEKLLSERWDDPSVFDGIKNIFASLASLRTVMTTPQIYRHYINILKILGSGVQGTVSSAKLVSGNASLAIKNVAESEDVIGLVREFLVGWQLNKLSTKTPVFSHMYSMVRCSKVLATKKETPVTFCSRAGFSNIAQFIPGVEVGKSDGTISVETFTKTFMLILFGLREASEMNYTHNDLHTSNVFYRKLPAAWNFKVEWGGKTYWTTTDTIPVILDYGLSRIDTPHGPIYPTGPDWIKSLKITSKAVPLQDVYKFIMWSFVFFSTIQPKIRWMIEYFHPTLSQKELDKIFDARFTLEGDFRNQPLDSYIDFFMKRVPDGILKSAPNDALHTFGEYSTPINFYQSIGIDVSRFGGLKDSYQWYLFKKFGGKGGNKELEVIVPVEINSLIRLAKDFLKELEIWKKQIGSVTRKEQVVVLGKVGDRILVILAESKTINFALNYVKRNYQNEIREINSVVAKIKENLLFFMQIYKRLVEISKKEKAPNFGEVSLTSDLAAIHPPEYSF